MPTSCTWKVPFRGKFGAYDLTDVGGGAVNMGDGARRVVPPFSVQSIQRNTIVRQPPRNSATKERPPNGETNFRRCENGGVGLQPFLVDILFRRAYLRGDFPLVLSHTAKGCKLVWKVGFKNRLRIESFQ